MTHALVRVKNFDSAVWEKHKDRFMWVATVAKFLQNPVLKQQLLDTGARTIVEATEDTVWGIGWTLSHPNTYIPRKWRGPNLMGILLTEIRTYVAMKEASPPFSMRRWCFISEFLNSLRCSNSREGGDTSEKRNEDASRRKDTVDSAVEFAVKVLDNTGNPDTWVTDEWPGADSVRQVKEWLEDHKSVDVRDLMNDLQFCFSPNPSEMKFVPSGKSEEWFKACFYILEGAVGLRRF